MKRLALLVLAVAAFAPSAGGLTYPNGLYGTVTKWPTAPVCRVGEPCSAPVQLTLLFSHRGHATVRTRSAANGAYRVALPAGYYTVRSIQKIGFSYSPRPAKVHVRTDYWDKLNFVFDTGIR